MFPPVEPAPADKLTLPPLPPPLLLPPLTETQPLPPALLLPPAPMQTLPEDADDEPEDKHKLPLLPPLDEPLNKLTSPLALPPQPPSADDTHTLPLPAALPPLLTDTLPPLLDDPAPA